MNKKAIHKAVALTLAVLVFFSTVSFSVEKHYCGTDLVDIAILFSDQVEEDPCAEEEDPCVEEASLAEDISCCKDVVEFFEGQEGINNSAVENLKAKQQLLFTAFVYAYTSVFEEFSRTKLIYDYYSPPDLVEDRVIQHQVFLI